MIPILTPYCPVCGKRFDAHKNDDYRNYVECADHIKEEHPDEKELPDFTFDCPMCGKRFDDPHECREHISRYETVAAS